MAWPWQPGAAAERARFFRADQTRTLIAIGLPLVVVGSWLGDRVIRRLDPKGSSAD